MKDCAIIIKAAMKLSPTIFQFVYMQTLTANMILTTNYTNISSLIHFIDFAKNAIFKRFAEFFPDCTPRFAVAVASSADFMTVEGKRKFCHSIHIHIPNVKMIRREQSSFWKKLNCFMDEDDELRPWRYELNISKEANFFDECVYDKNRKLRSVHCSKHGENRPLVLIEGTFKETIISLGDDDAVVVSWPEEVKPQMKKISTPTNTTLEQFEKIKLLSEIIDDRYICAPGCYSVWRSIVWALRSENPEYKDIAKKMSKRPGANYDEAAFDKLWDDYKDGNISIGSFHHYAKVSNEPRYEEICSKHIKKMSKKFLFDSLNTNSVIDSRKNNSQNEEGSKFISVEDLEDVFKCSTIIAPELKKTLILCKENWYVLIPETQLWKPIKEPTYYVTCKIREYIDHSNVVNSTKMKGTCGEDREKLLVNQNGYNRMFNKINTPSYMSVCLKNLRAQVVNDTFEDKLDTTPYILAFRNGIMDLKTKTFREGLRWDDFLTDTIPYDWKPPDPSRVDYVKTVLKKILNNNSEHLEYYLSVLGYSFLGVPQLEKSLYFMIDGTDNGKGDNGKSFFFDILNSLMPNYIYKSKGTMLEDGNPKVHKQLSMTKRKRLVWLDEFTTKRTNAALIKELADGKTIENEIMFGTSESINILYKIFILSNHIPNVDSNEEAVYNRYKQISFSSHFDRTGARLEDDPDKLLFRADIDLSDKLKTEYANEIFNIIIDYAAKYTVSKLPKVPEKFQKDAQETKVKNDEFQMWFNDNCEKDDSKRVPMELLREKSGFDDKTIKEGMKRVGFKYDKDLRSGLGKNVLNKPYKGGFVGCFLKENIEE
jgi:phage/plasmid-associated DNA primase